MPEAENSGIRGATRDSAHSCYAETVLLLSSRALPAFSSIVSSFMTTQMNARPVGYKMFVFGNWTVRDGLPSLNVGDSTAT
jgi:hypothetical protein